MDFRDARAHLDATPDLPRHLNLGAEADRAADQAADVVNLDSTAMPHRSQRRTPLRSALHSLRRIAETAGQPTCVRVVSR